MGFGANCAERRRGVRCSGFTLIELLVAIGIMAVMAGLSWRGIDGMLQAQSRLQERSDAVLTLQTGLAQWGTDLDALITLAQTPALDWDGRSLRLTRLNPSGTNEGVLVVAWTRRDTTAGGEWLRWQSPPLRSQGELTAAWARAGAWAQNPSDDDKRREIRIAAASQWQIFYHRSGSWGNPLSSDTSTQPGLEGAKPEAAALPDGIRLVLTLPQSGPLSGTLTRDWIRPGLGGGKS